MRRTLIDNARRRQSSKRGGLGTKRRMLTDSDLVSLPLADELLDLDEALADLEKKYEVHAQVVKLKFFAGLTTAEIAEITNVSVATTERYWVLQKRGYTNVCNGKTTKQKGRLRKYPCHKKGETKRCLYRLAADGYVGRVANRNKTESHNV